MKIITLTLNPAFDVHCHFSSFKAESENFGTVTSKDAGGKGINISRALLANGIQSLPLVSLGSENGSEFASILEKDGLKCKFFTAPGRIRENYTLHTEGSDETRISFDSTIRDAGLTEKCEAFINTHLDSDTIVTFTGSIPSCVSKQDCKDMLKRLRNAGVKTVIDCRSFSLDDITECRPFLIKPNKPEISSMLGHDVSEISEIISAAKKIQAAGVENVMISLGANGAVLVTSNGAFHAQAPNITPLSTIGAGDSSIAGFLAATAESLDCGSRLKTAVAYGSAACLTEGTRPPMKKDVEELLSKITYRGISI